MFGMPDEKRKLPAWLLGLIFAVILTVIVLAVLGALGYGDDPVLGTRAVVFFAV